MLNNNSFPFDTKTSNKTISELQDILEKCIEYKTENSTVKNEEEIEYKIEPPTKRRKTLKIETKAEYSDIELYCICRKPWDPYGTPMISCDTCLNWYHPSCAGLGSMQFLEYCNTNNKKK